MTMTVDNDTSGPVDYEQTGGGPGEEEDPKAAAVGDPPVRGFLNQANVPGDFKEFLPAEPPQYKVFFRSLIGKERAESAYFDNPHATVTLNADWTVDVK